MTASSEADEGDRARLAAIRAADDLAALAGVVDADSEQEAYLAAKREWRERRGLTDAEGPAAVGLPGSRVRLDGCEFWVHGITHAGTRAERDHLRGHVSRFLRDGAAVFCEQGVRSMYFADHPSVRGMDDYSWAMREVARLDDAGAADGLPDAAADGFEDVRDAVADRLREAAFPAIDAGSAVYGEAVESTLGAAAASLLGSHEDLATGRDFESFELTRLAAADPTTLRDLQAYYERTLLPQPLEREWVRRHDRVLERLTYARNERMADYLVYHHESEPAVHALVGAAHQPGIRYYLEAHRDDRRSLDGFAPVG